jgi:hypothetical protein
MTKTKSTKRIKVMAIVMALSVIVCGVAVGVTASAKSDSDSTESDYDDYYIVNADDIYKVTPYEEDTDIKKFLDKDMQIGNSASGYAYQEVMDPCPIDADALYNLHAKWVYDESDQIYKISFKPDPKNAAMYGILQYNSERHYLKKFLNRDDLTPEQIEKIKNFKYPEGF